MSDEADVKVEATVADEPVDNGPNSIMDPGGDNSDWDLGSEHPEGGSTAAPEPVSAGSEPAPEPAKPDDGFSSDLLEYAATFGFKRDDFATPGELAKSIQMVQRFATTQQPQSNQTTGQASPSVGQTPAVLGSASRSAASHQPNATQGTPGQFELKIPPQLLDGRSYDPEIGEFVQGVQGMHQHYQTQLQRLEQQNNSEVARLSSELNAVKEFHHKQQLERFFDEADALFAADESLADKLGKGGRNDLPADSPALQERRAVLEQMFLAQGMFAQSGKPIPSTDKLYAIAKGIKYSDQTQQIARRQIADQLRDSKGRFTAPPAHRPASDLPHGPDRAKNVLAKYIRDTGIFDTEADTGLAA